MATNGHSTTDLTIGARLQKLALEKPDKAAFIFWDKFGNRTVMTRKQVWEKSSKCAAILRQLGVKKGDVICNTLINSQERVITTYGTILAGAVSMHGQKFLASGEDLIKNWKDTDCKGMLYDPNEKKGAVEILKGIKSVDPKLGKLVYEGLPSMSLLIPIRLADSINPWIQDLDNETKQFYDDTVCLDDFAFLFPTSGSTGFAKMVAHTHKSIIEASRMYASILGMTEDTVYLNHRSMGYVGGNVHRYPISGLTRICIDFTFGKPDNIEEFLLKIVDFEKCDLALFIPVELLLLTEYFKTRPKEFLAGNRHRLNCIGTGSGLVTKEHVKIIGTITDCVKNIYGSTEIGMLIAQEITDPETYESGVVGAPGEGIEIKILNDELKEVERGSFGEIYIRTKSVAKCYMNMEEQTKKSFLNDNWFRTSDVGMIDDKGRLHCFCRKNNVIFHHGYMHYPGWMESKINAHPQIQSCVVLGIPEPKVFEEICLCVVRVPESNLTPEETREYCRSLFLTNEEQAITPIPKYVFMMEEYPVNVNAKVDRKRLKQIVMEKIEKGNCPH